MAETTGTAELLTVYRPHKAGLPPIGPYFRELWERRDFAKELAETNMRATNTNTVIGQLWLILNPTLMAFVYWFLVTVLNRSSTPTDFAQLTGGLFLYFYITGIVTASATSVTNAGSLVLNMNFPKLLLILSNTYLAFRRYIPTLAVYAVIHVLCLVGVFPGDPKIGWELLAIPFIILLGTMLGVGLGAIFATFHVYFRDTAQFLPHFIRILMYLSPVLYSVETFVHRAGDLKHVIHANPFYPVLGLWADATHGVGFNWTIWAEALAWGLLFLVVGCLYFMSREREFAVRL